VGRGGGRALRFQGGTVKGNGAAGQKAGKDDRNWVLGEGCMRGKINLIVWIALLNAGELHCWVMEGIGAAEGAAGRRDKHGYPLFPRRKNDVVSWEEAMSDE